MAGAGPERRQQPRGAGRCKCTTGTRPQEARRRDRPPHPSTRRSAARGPTPADSLERLDGHRHRPQYPRGPRVLAAIYAASARGTVPGQADTRRRSRTRRRQSPTPSPQRRSLDALSTRCRTRPTGMVTCAPSRRQCWTPGPGGAMSVTSLSRPTSAEATPPGGSPTATAVTAPRVTDRADSVGTLSTCWPFVVQRVL